MNMMVRPFAGNDGSSQSTSGDRPSAIVYALVAGLVANTDVFKHLDGYIKPVLGEGPQCVSSAHLGQLMGN